MAVLLVPWSGFHNCVWSNPAWFHLCTHAAEGDVVSWSGAPAATLSVLCFASKHRVLRRKKTGKLEVIVLLRRTMYNFSLSVFLING